MEQLNLIENRPPVADDLNAAIIPFDNQHIIIRPLTVDEFTQEQLQQFLAVPFIHHYEIPTAVANYLKHAKISYPLPRN
ncbi:MAG: hypothetical protein IKO26_01185 [Paludibacteraceae bacterium]|nr:hypothetical protein [Paludibacteraceae bacterium]